MKYPAERREAILKKMLPPHNQSIAEIAQEEGLSEATLYNWRKALRDSGDLMPTAGSPAAQWRSVDKFAAVVATVALNEAALSAYCREHGLYPEALKTWRLACEQANEPAKSQAQRVKEARKVDEQRIKELEKDLRYKEKALAETAALLVLRKKAQAIWGEAEAV
jgi:transposase-like protein